MYAFLFYNFILLTMVFGIWDNVKATVSVSETWPTYCLEVTCLLVVHTEEGLFFPNEILFGFWFTQEIYSPNKARKTKQTSALDGSWWLKPKAGPVSVGMVEGGTSWPATWWFSIPKHTTNQGSVFIFRNRHIKYWYGVRFLSLTPAKATKFFELQ